MNVKEIGLHREQHDKYRKCARDHINYGTPEFREVKNDASDKEGDEKRQQNKNSVKTTEMQGVIYRHGKTITN